MGGYGTLEHFHFWCSEPRDLPFTRSVKGSARADVPMRSTRSKLSERYTQDEIALES